MLNNYLIFKLGRKEYALNLKFVNQVAQIVEIVEIPNGPKYLLGLINVHGKITPVLNLRYLLNLKERAPKISDQLIILQTEQTALSILVDQVSDIIPAHQENSTSAQKILPDAQFFDVVIQDQEKFILGINPEALLSSAELTKINKKIRKEYDKITEQALAH